MVETQFDDGAEDVFPHRKRQRPTPPLPHLIPTPTPITRPNMPKKMSPKYLAQRSKDFITAWRQYAPDMKLSDRTLAEFEAESGLPHDVQQRLDTAKAQCAGLIGERNKAMIGLNKSLVMVANAIRSTPELGPNSAFYRALGFKVESERKPPGPKRRRAATDPTPGAGA